MSDKIELKQESYNFNELPSIIPQGSTWRCLNKRPATGATCLRGAFDKKNVGIINKDIAQSMRIMIPSNKE